jgi:hypothetical protein
MEYRQYLVTVDTQNIMFASVQLCLQVLYGLLNGFVLIMLIIHGVKYISFQPRLALISKTLVSGASWQPTLCVSHTAVLALAAGLTPPLYQAAVKEVPFNP